VANLQAAIGEVDDLDALADRSLRELGSSIMKRMLSYWSVSACERVRSARQVKASSNRSRGAMGRCRSLDPATPLLAIGPEPGFQHPNPQGLTPDIDTVELTQLLGRQRQIRWRSSSVI
jgi:hypothetical protein